MSLEKTNCDELICNSLADQQQDQITVNQVCTDLMIPGDVVNDGAWRSIFVDLTKKGSMTYLIFVDRQTLYPEVFELGMRSLWKQTKVAFQDVFREYRIPAEILTTGKFFFGTGKFMKFLKRHGIVQISESDAGNGNKLAGVLTSVKALIHNSRFWHEELRKLRENIAKSLLVTEDKYVQVDHKCEEDIKFSFSDSSTEDSSECKFDSGIRVMKSSPDKENSPEEPKIKCEVTCNDGSSKDFKGMEDYIWIDNLRCMHMSCSNGMPSNEDADAVKVNTSAPAMNSYSPSYVLPGSMTRIQHCAIDETFFPVSNSFQKNRRKAHKKRSHKYQKLRSTFLLDGLYVRGEQFDDLSEVSRSTATDTNSTEEQNSCDVNPCILKLRKSGSGDGCTAKKNVPVIATRVHRFTITSLEKTLARYPIEMLPLKYDNMYLTEKDLNWKAIAINVITFPSKCYYMFIDCATKFPEISLQFQRIGSSNIKQLLQALCILWQKHGKPIEIHSPPGKIFTCSEFNKFIRKYNFSFYYDSPYLKGDMEIGHAMVKYKKLLGRNKRSYNYYIEFLKIQRKIRKMTIEGSGKETDNKRQRTLFSLNRTTCSETNDICSNSSESSSTKIVGGILRKRNGNKINPLSWKSVVVDRVRFKNKTFALFIDVETCYPEIKHIGHSFRPYCARTLLRIFKEFFCEKSVPQEVHTPDICPFNIKGVIRFMKNNGIRYYRQSQYFNGGHCMYKCLEHMKSLIYESVDIPSAMYNCRETSLPWLGLSPENLASGSRIIPLSSPLPPPWEEIILDVIRTGKVDYLVVYDYGSMYPECFRLRRFSFSFCDEIVRSFKKACSVLGCPRTVWTSDKSFFTSDPFFKLLHTRNIKHFLLNPKEERNVANMKARIEQKLSVVGNIESALTSAREGFIHFIGCCPVSRLREQETRMSESLMTEVFHKKKVRFNLSQTSFYDLSLSDSDAK